MSLQVIAHRVVYSSREYGHAYNSFPSAAITVEGEVLVAFRQARHTAHITHVDISSHAMLLRSTDLGQTFNASLLQDECCEGVQDPCINLLRDGTLLTTYFTWVVQRRDFFEGEVGEGTPWREFNKDYIRRIGGLFSIRSRDGGRSWDERIPIVEGSEAIRGKGVELQNGDFLSASYDQSGVVSIYQTSDQGLNWEKIATISDDNGSTETSLFLTRSGKLIAFLRNQKQDSRNVECSPLRTAESHDLGKTWSTPVSRPIYSSSPFEAIQLRSGKVLVTFGYRAVPYGIRAILLDGECENWDKAHECILRDDGRGTDIGYTSAVQLPSDDILVFYYYYGEDGCRYIGATTCRES